MTDYDDLDIRQEEFEALAVGDLVITRLKNRWGLFCAGTIESMDNGTADVLVWNLHGPGANVLVPGIPLSELTHHAKKVELES